MIQAVHTLHRQNLCVCTRSGICNTQSSMCVLDFRAVWHSLHIWFPSGMSLLHLQFTLFHIYTVSDYSLFQWSLDQKTWIQQARVAYVRDCSFMIRRQMLHSWDANGVTTQGSHTLKSTLVVDNELVIQPRTSITNYFWSLNSQYLQHLYSASSRTGVSLLESTNGKTVENTIPSSIYGWSPKVYLQHDLF